MSKEEALRHVLNILDFDQTTISSLNAARITTFMKLVNTRMDTYRDMASDKKSGFTHSEADQIELFKEWYDRWSIKAQNITDMQEMMDCFTEEDFFSFCARYRRSRNPTLGSPGTGSAQGIGSASKPIVLEKQEAPSIRVSLKDYPTTTGKSAE